MQKFCKITCFLFFIFAEMVLPAQEISVLDSLLQAEKTAKNDSVKFATLSKIALVYADSSYEKSLVYWRKALDLATKKRYRLGMADCYQQIGYILIRQGEFPTALQELNNALTIFEFIKNKKGMGEVYNDIGLIYKSWGRYELALQNYLSSLKIYDEIGDDEGSSIASNNIGQIHYYRAEYEKAITFFQKYLHVNQRNNYARAVAGAANNIASAYVELNQYDKALDYYTKSLQIYDSIGIDLGVAILQDNIGSLYSKKEQYSDALLFHKNALRKLQNLNSKPRISPVLMNIGLVYSQTQNYPLALDFFLQSKEIAEELKQRENLKEIYFNLSEVYEFLGKHKQALNFHKKYLSVKDSLMNNETAEKLTSMEARYETDKKSRELQLLQSKLDRQNRVQIVTLIIVVLFIFQTLVLIRENYSKRKAIQKAKNAEAVFRNQFKLFYASSLETIKSLSNQFSNVEIIPNNLTQLRSTLLWVYPKDNFTIIFMAHNNALKSNNQHFIPSVLSYLYQTVNIHNEFDAKKFVTIFQNTTKKDDWNSNTFSSKLLANCILVKNDQLSYYGNFPFWHRKPNGKYNRIESTNGSSEPTLLNFNNDDEFFFSISSSESIPNNSISKGIDTILSTLSNETFENSAELVKSNYEFWKTSHEECCEAIILALRK